MATCTTETTVTFERSFDLTAIEERQPPRAYRLVSPPKQSLSGAIAHVTATGDLPSKKSGFLGW